MSSSSSGEIENSLLTEDSNPLLTEAGEILKMEVGGSSSSSQTGSIILDNIELFRQYSLDPDLMELYFDRGSSYKTVDLDALYNGSSSSTPASSSSGEGLFLLEITLRKRSFLSGDIPEDLELSIFEEEIDDSTHPGIFGVERSGTNLIRVFLNNAPDPDGASAFSFRLNIEGPGFAPSRTLFRFARGGYYSHTIALSPNLDPGRSSRLGPEYRQYLMGWIEQFWSARDSGTLSSLPSLIRPFPQSFVPFYPFAHAMWRLLKDFEAADYASALSGPISFVPGNEGLVAEENFLGVSPNVWSCISNGLYKFDGYPEGSDDPLDVPKPPRTYKDPDTSFDCRSFAVIGAKFIRSQLADVCPGAEVKVIGIGTHYLVSVNLPGDPKPCCVGSFLYEPMNGSTYKDAEEFCNDDPGFCEGFDKPPTIYEPGNENSDGDFGDPNWEDSADELARIESSICGCLNGTYEAGSREAQLKQECDSGNMQSWIANNLSFTPDASAANKEPGLTGPQSIECERCLTTWTASWDCELEKWDLLADCSCVPEGDPPAGLNSWSEVEGKPCERQYKILSDQSCGSNLECLEKVGIPQDEVEAPKEGPNGCCGKWCVLDSHGKNTGDCIYSYKEGWELENSENRAGPFQADQKCLESDCQCPPGYRKVSTGAQMIGSLQEFTCQPDCNYEPFLCENTYGPNFCCEENIFNEGNSCLPCIKNRTLRLYDQPPGGLSWG